MLKDFKKLAKKRPLTAGVVGVSAVYSVYTLYRATQAGKDQFWIWDRGVDGIGASTSTTSSTSSSHAMMSRGTSGDLMKHPTALYGISGHCTGGVHGACSNPHCNVHGGMNGLGSMSTSTSTSSVHAHKRTSNYGEDTYETPSQLFGVPNKIKRRVMVNEMNEGFNGYNNPHESDIYSHAQPQQMSAEEAEMIAGAGGWL